MVSNPTEIPPENSSNPRPKFSIIGGFQFESRDHDFTSSEPVEGGVFSKNKIRREHVPKLLARHIKSRFILNVATLTVSLLFAAILIPCSIISFVFGLDPDIGIAFYLLLIPIAAGILLAVIWYIWQPYIDSFEKTFPSSSFRLDLSASFIFIGIGLLIIILFIATGLFFHLFA